jgi:broad specificity phosphatase PhoE
VSKIVRLTLLSHGMTDAMSAGRFPGDEPLSDLGARQVRALGNVGSADLVVAGPETRTRQTAELCGWQPDVEAALADLDCGCWRGQSLGDVDPIALHQWMIDPASTPHGGESISTLTDRIAGWLDGVSSTPRALVAVTHPAIIRVAILGVLRAPPESFWRIDIPPASRTVMHHRAGSWTIRMDDAVGRDR